MCTVFCLARCSRWWWRMTLAAGGDVGVMCVVAALSAAMAMRVASAAACIGAAPLSVAVP
jgi:hypothetical protein